MFEIVNVWDEKEKMLDREMDTFPEVMKKFFAESGCKKSFMLVLGESTKIRASEFRGMKRDCFGNVWVTIESPDGSISDINLKAISRIVHRPEKNMEFQEMI